MSRDPRFDGEFYLGVTSTGIYCRPICPARLPAESNVRYFRHAAQAAEAGFRPCLRCRPEAAPGSPARGGSLTTLQRALQLIRAGALNDGSGVPILAERLGVGDRYLRKLFQRELGISPLAVAQNQRLLLARQLIGETSLPLVDVAHAAGFGSVRRFNSAIRSAYGIAPGEMRRGRQPAKSTGLITLELRYRPPYDWDGVVDFLHRHLVAGVESLVDGTYQRHIQVGQFTGRCRITHLPQRHALQLVLDLPGNTPLMPIVARARRMFDLDANPSVIAAGLGSSPVLAKLMRANPGIRSPGYWSATEAAVRAIVGQQVSTTAARGICARFAAECTPRGALTVFPAPDAIGALADSQFPMPTRRRDTLRRLGDLYTSKQEAWSTDELAELAGIGPWTLAMVAMRGLGDPDAFPLGDLGLVRAWEALGNNRRTLSAEQLQWRPWRAYAANLLWRTLA